MKIGFKNILDSHNTDHAISILSIIPIYIHFGIETRYIMKILKEMATIYARLVNQYKFRCHTKFDELNIQDFDFQSDFKCDDANKIEILKNLSINIFELNFYQDQNKRNYNLIPVAISKNDESDRVVDLLFYENHYALIKKLHFFLGNYHKKFICKRHNW